MKFIVQLQSTGHMNLKNNIPIMHHITPFRDEKFINFLGRGTAPPQTPPPRRLRRLDSRVFVARPATPDVPVALDAHVAMALCLCPCLSVCLSITSRCSVKKMDGLICFLAWRLLSTSPTLCLKEIQVSAKITVLPLELFPKL